MKIKKNSEAYKKGIRYAPNLDTIIPNAEEAAHLLGIHPYPCLEPPVRNDYYDGDLSYKSYRSNTEKFNWRSLVTKKSSDLLEPIDKKFEW
jgi:hypothetical protein